MFDSLGGGYVFAVDAKEGIVKGEAIAYVRVSSAEQNQGFSIPAQRTLLQRYAHEHGLRISVVFTDAETAKAAGRRHFTQMLRYLREHPNVRVVLAEKTDRLYRNFRDYTTIEDLNIEVHLAKEGEVLSKDSKSHQKFIHGIKVLMAKNFLDNLSEEVKKGHAQARRISCQGTPWLSKQFRDQSNRR